MDFSESLATRAVPGDAMRNSVVEYCDTNVTAETRGARMRSVMNLTRIAMASVFVAGSVGVTLAAPASAADPHALGTYTFEAEDGEQATWTMSPCSDDSDHCVYVTSTGNAQRAAFSGNAYWTVGSWIMFVDQPDAILCHNGTKVPGKNTYSWDATNLGGYISIFSGGACDAPAESLAIPFKLTKSGTGPIQYPTAPAPVENHPLMPAEVGPAPAAPGGPMPVETDPAIVATPPSVPSDTDQLTEAEVAEPGFNAGGHGR